MSNLTDNLKRALAETESSVNSIKKDVDKRDQNTRDIAIFMASRADYYKYTMRNLSVKDRLDCMIQYCDKNFYPNHKMEVYRILRRHGFPHFNDIFIANIILCAIIFAYPMYWIASYMLDGLAFYIFGFLVYIVITVLFALFASDMIYTSSFKPYRLKNPHKWK